MRLSIRGLVLMLVVGGCTSAPRQVEPTLEQKLARLMMLEQTRSLGDGEIFTRLADPTPRVRRRAALALARIGDPLAAGPLTTALSDPEPGVREMAAFALGLLDGMLPPESLEALQQGVQDPMEEVRARSMEALSRKTAEESRAIVAEHIGTTLSARVQELSTQAPPFSWGENLVSSVVRLPHVELRLGLYALARLDGLRWAWSTLAMEDGRARFRWWPAAWTTAELAAEELRPLLEDYAGANDDFLRLLAVRGLGRLSPATARNAVLTLLEDADEKVRIEAARAAARIGAREAVPRLLELTEADTVYGQVEAIRALASLPDPRALDPLIDRLADPHPWVRAAVLRALAHQDRDGFWLLLSGLGWDIDWRVRRELADLLGDIGGPRAVGLLVELTRDRDFRVRREALLALAETAPSEEATPVLVKHLSADDPHERAAAAEGLRQVQSAGVVEPLQQAFERSLGDTEPEARSAILSALAAFGPEPVEPFARRALDDRFWLVRRRAAEILHSLGDDTVVARGPDPDRTLEDYVAMLRPRYTPQAFIRTEKGAIEVELFVLDAPITASHFMRLAREGFYNGLTFHHVVPNDRVEAGDPRGDSLGGAGFHLRTEISMRPVLRGTLLMAQEGKDTAGSRFLITHLPQPHLAGRYTVLGQVTGGMNIVDRLEPGDPIREIVIWDGETLGSGASPAEPATDQQP